MPKHNFRVDDKVFKYINFVSRPYIEEIKVDTRKTGDIYTLLHAHTLKKFGSFIRISGSIFYKT